MRIDWIEDLIALLDTGGVADAAARRNVTQPAFSRRLKSLEEVLGVNLVDRAARPSGPSSVLHNHSNRLRRLASEQRTLIASMRDAERRGASQLVLVCQHAISMSLGPYFVDLLSGGGERAVRLQSATKDECEAILYAEDASISITYRVPAEPEGELPAYLEQRVLGQDALLPVVGSEHAKRLMWDAHNGRLRLVAYPPDVFLGLAFERHITPTLEKSCEIVAAAETGFSSAALQMARVGLGIAWVPSTLVTEALAEKKLVELTHELGRLDLEIIAQCLTPRTEPSVDLAWRDLADVKLFDPEYPSATR